MYQWHWLMIQRRVHLGIRIKVEGWLTLGSRTFLKPLGLFEIGFWRMDRKRAFQAVVSGLDEAVALFENVMRVVMDEDEVLG